jgi:SWI/SNF-related matrix-associated actin-dependent regulator 1 of chromatin subfamily A
MRLTFPNRAWAEFRWNEDEELEPLLADALLALSDMPGVHANDGMVRISRSAWGTDAFLTLSGWFLISPRKMPSELWAPSRPLYPHQVEGARFLVQHDGGLCADEMGTGKTTTAIVAAETIARTEKPDAPRLIVAPGYTRAVWFRELSALGAVRDEDDFAFAKGRTPSDDFNWDASWWFVHYDIVFWWASYMVSNRRGRPIVAIADEAHWFKNSRAKRSLGTQAAIGVATARILLTGTPMANRPSELWWPLTVLDSSTSWGGPVDFRMRYCGAYRDDHGLVDTLPTHTEEFQERLRTRYIRRTLDDAGVELPARTRQPLTVSWAQKDRNRYDKLVTKLGADKLLEAVLARRAGTETLPIITELRKLCSRVKEEATTSYVLDAIAQGESVVVFTWMKATAERLAKAIAKKSSTTYLYVVHGERSQSDRDELVADFQDRGGVLLATLESLKEGVTLHTARILVIHDLDWVPSNILQAEARIYRIGQTRPVISTWMLAEDSIDTLLAGTLAHKAESMHKTLGIVAAQQAVDEIGLHVEDVFDADVDRFVENVEHWREGA